MDVEEIYNGKNIFGMRGRSGSTFHLRGDQPIQTMELFCLLLRDLGFTTTDVVYSVCDCFFTCLIDENKIWFIFEEGCDSIWFYGDSENDTEAAFELAKQLEAILP